MFRKRVRKGLITSSFNYNFFSDHLASTGFLV